MNKIFIKNLSTLIEEKCVDYFEKNVSLEIIKAFINILEEKNPYTKGHSHRVEIYTRILGNGLFNKGLIKNDELEDLSKAAILHDIGKIGIIDTVLNKQGDLTAEEWEHMREHTEIGSKIVRDSSFLKQYENEIKYHHEWFDRNKSYYAEEKKKTAIPLFPQIIALADAFDAMSSDRPYRPAMKDEAICEQIEKGKNTQFNPIVCEVFLERKDRLFGVS